MTVRAVLVGGLPLVAAVGVFILPNAGPVSPRRAASRVDPEENEATRVTPFGVCGVKRWAVKTLTDPAARSVNLVAKRATVAGMNALPAPSLPADDTTRLASERQSFRVTAKLVAYRLEADEDIHLVLAGGRNTMIAEMPSPNCDRGARARRAITRTRRRFEARYGAASDQWTYVGQRVTLTGVRFFDFPHGQAGVADNAVELHPVFGFQIAHHLRSHASNQG